MGCTTSEVRFYNSNTCILLCRDYLSSNEHEAISILFLLIIISSLYYTLSAYTLFNLLPPLLQHLDLHPHAPTNLGPHLRRLPAILGARDLELVAEPGPEARDVVPDPGLHRRRVRAPDVRVERALALQHLLAPELEPLVPREPLHQRHRLPPDRAPLPRRLQQRRRVCWRIRRTRCQVQLSHARAVHLAHDGPRDLHTLEGHRVRERRAPHELVLALRTNRAVSPPPPPHIFDVLGAAARKYVSVFASEALEGPRIPREHHHEEPTRVHRTSRHRRIEGTYQRRVWCYVCFPDEHIRDAVRRYDGRIARAAHAEAGRVRAQRVPFRGPGRDALGFAGGLGADRLDGGPEELVVLAGLEHAPRQHRHVVPAAEATADRDAEYRD